MRLINARVKETYGSFVQIQDAPCYLAAKRIEALRDTPAVRHDTYLTSHQYADPHAWST